MIFLIWFITFCVYLFTLCPTVYVGDSGELITASFSLGIAHPPGYPVYVILGKIATIVIPFANIAYRINIMSAVLSATTIAVLYLLMKKSIEVLRCKGVNLKPKNLEILIPLIAVLIFAFSRTFWSSSVEAEVYSLHMFFVVSVIYFLFRADILSVLLSAFILGIGVANHQTIILLLPLFLILLYRIKINKIYIIAFILGVFFVGVFVYYLLPVRALARPELNWGSPASIGELVEHILRKQYGRLSKLPRTFVLFIGQIKLYFKLLVSEFTPWLLLFAIPGGFYLFKKNKSLFIVSLYIFFAYSIGFIIMLNYQVTSKHEDIMRVFFIPSYLSVILWIFIGLIIIMRFLPTYIKLFIVFLPFVPFMANLPFNNLSKNLVAYDYGKNILTLPTKDSILFLSQDNEVFNTCYLSKVERFRKGKINVYDELGCVFENIYGEYFIKIGKAAHKRRLNKFQKKIIAKYPGKVWYVLASNIRKMKDVNDVQIGIEFVALGKNDDLKLRNGWRKMITRDLYINYKNKDYLVLDVITQYHLLLGEYYNRLNDKKRAMKAYKMASKIGRTVDWVQSNVGAVYTREGLTYEALEEYKRGVEANPYKPSRHYDLALAYNRVGRVDDAILEYKKAIQLDFRYSSAYNNLANIYLRRKDVKSAIFYYKKAIDSNQDNAQAYFNMGGALEELKQYDKALLFYMKAIKRRRNYVEAMNNIAGVYFTKGNINKAILWYKKALGILPDYVDARFNLGVAYATKATRTKDIKQAKINLMNAARQWQLILKSHPNHKPSLDNLKQVISILKR